MIEPLTKRLFRLAAVPASALSDVEIRVLRLTTELLHTYMLALRVDGGELKPLTEDIAVRAVQLAFMSAMEIEKPLRDLRERIEQT